MTHQPPPDPSGPHGYGPPQPGYGPPPARPGPIPPPRPSAPPVSSGQPFPYAGHGTRQPGRPAVPGQQSQATSFPYPMRPTGEYAPRPRAVLPPYAGWWRRALGLAIDLAVVFGPAAVLVLIAVAVGANATPGAARTLAVTLFILLAVAAIAITITLQTRAEGRTGQTVGRRATGTRLVGYYDGLPIGAWRSLGRFLTHIADHGFCYIGFIWPLWDKHKQTFADKIMDTVVVKANP